VRTAVATWQAAREQSDRVALDARAVWVDADRAHLEQILINLLDNADKFSPASTVIRVSVAPGEGQAVLRVADEGDGISPELTPRVFEPFVQGATTPDRSRGSIGVSLTLVKRLTELHGGPRDGQQRRNLEGSDLRGQAARDCPPDSTRPMKEVGESAAKRSIVLIEDNEDARPMATNLLQGRVTRSGALPMAKARCARWRHAGPRWCSSTSACPA
jgi:hypothetical protein